MTALWPLPSGWAWQAFNQVASVASDLVEPRSFGNMPHIAPNHIERGTGRLLPYATVISDGVVSPKHHFRPGQILYSKIRPYLAKVVYVDFEGLCSADMYPIDTLLEPRYLKWWMLTRSFTSLAANQQARTILPKINRRALERLPVPVAPALEQSRIVEILEDHLSRLDTAQRGIVVALGRSEALWTLALHHQMAGPLVRLGALKKSAGYGTSCKCEAGGAGLPVARIPNIVSGVVDLKDEKRATDPNVDLSNLLLRVGDILIVRTNGSKRLIGRAATVEQDMNVAFASYLIRYRVDIDRVHPRWVQCALEAPQSRAAIEVLAASSAGQHNLSLQKLDALSIPVPSLEAQTETLRRLDNLRGDRLRLNNALDTANMRASALRRAMLAAAFEGKLTGRHTDDEVIEEMAGV